MIFFLRLQEGYDQLGKYVQRPLREILNDEQIEMLKGPDKGASGKIIEKLIGLNNSTATLDFEDGELKANKCTSTGHPQETIAITQFSNPDILFNPVPFEDSVVCKKVSNVLFAFVCKEGKVEDWFLHTVRHLDFTSPQYAAIYAQLREDYYSICREADSYIAADVRNTLHTLNGKYLQVRTKDSKPYHAMHSEKYGRQVSDKGRAFFLQRKFLEDIQNNTI